MKKHTFDATNKFSFSLEFQLEVLRFLIQGKEGSLVMNKVKPAREVVREFIEDYALKVANLDV